MSLTARSLHVQLGRAHVLRGVDLVAAEGRLTAIIGPNGSGKTTLLRALTGEIIPASGAVSLNSHDISGLNPAVLAGMRSVLPQQSVLSFPFTVSEIVGIGLTASAVPAINRQDLIRAALSAVGLPGHAGRLYQELSGGEQQRVQLARAMAQVWHPSCAAGPRWLLLDEPVSSLDIAHQMKVMQVVTEYARRGGGVLAVMHDLNLTAMFADQIILMDRGRVAASGPPAEVLTDRHLSSVYGCSLRINHVPSDGLWVLPHSAVH